MDRTRIVGMAGKGKGIKQYIDRPCLDCVAQALPFHQGSHLEAGH